MKQNKSKNSHIHNKFNTSKINKPLVLLFTNSTYKIIKSNHLFEVRSSNKQRDQFIDDARYKQIILLALQNGLNSFRARGEVVVTIANSKKKNHSCTSLLIALDNYNNITVITAVQSYGVNKWHRGFIKVKNRINILPSVYTLPRLSDDELDKKNRDKIFNQKSIEQYIEDSIFLNYTKHNNLLKVN